MPSTLPVDGSLAPGGDSGGDGDGGGDGVSHGSSPKPCAHS